MLKENPSKLAPQNSSAVQLQRKLSRDIIPEFIKKISQGIFFWILPAVFRFNS